MHILSIEPTPSPNTMKINVSDSWPEGRRATYTAADADTAPGYIRGLLEIPGVKSVFRAADFIALDRTPKGDWQSILAKASESLGGSAGGVVSEPESADPYGEVKVLLQTFRGIPLQVRASAGHEQQRTALPERFSEAAVRAGTASPNLIKERKLEELGVRYGELREVLEAVAAEIDAAYDDARLDDLVRRSEAMGPGETDAPAPAESRELPADEVARRLALPEWQQRYAALQRLKPAAEDVPLLAQALADSNASVRRLATVYLGDIKTPEVLPHLFRALEDASPSVRRTAGDTLSDLGDPAAGPAMAKALRDPNKLVRWRAARFLYEAGDESAIAALRAAEDDPEFEVRMQIKMALERIEGGHEAAGSVWQQMTRRER